MKSTFITAFFLSSLAFASIGDICRWNGERGTCQSVSKCSAGFTVTGACPNDPEDVKCCIKKGCQKPDTSLQGSCFDTEYNSCSGGQFIKNQCPGPANVQCCIKDSAPSPPSTPKPPAPHCPAVDYNSGTLGTQNFIFSKSSTNTFAGAAGIAGKSAEACAAIAALSEVGAPLAAVCALGGIALDVLSDHAKECHDKSQCLKLSVLPLSTIPVPFCVGKGDGCCG